MSVSYGNRYRQNLSRRHRFRSPRYRPGARKEADPRRSLARGERAATLAVRSWGDPGSLYAGVARLTGSRLVADPCEIDRVMQIRGEAARSTAVAGAFLISGVTSYVALVVAKRSLGSDDFGQFALFWSLGFFAAAVCAAPNEQELARSLAVRLERGESGRREVRAAVRSTAVATSVVVALGTLGYVSGIFGTPSVGMIGVFGLLVGGEAITALVRGEMAALRDTSGLVTIVAVQGIVRASAMVLVAAVFGGLLLSCLAVAVPAVVAIAFLPRVRRRTNAAQTRTEPISSDGSSDGSIFSMAGVRRLAVATPPRALFAIGTPVLAAIVAEDDEQAVVGDVLAALSLTSAPVLIAAALQVVLLPRFAALAERGLEGAIQARTRRMMAIVAVGVTFGTAFAALFGLPVLEALFGASPQITPAALAAMTLGAGMLFLANLLVPVCIAVRDYSIVTVAWVAGAMCLAVTAFVPGDVGYSIGRAVLLGATAVVAVLLWGLRAVWLPRRWSGRAESRHTQRVGNEV